MRYFIVFAEEFPGKNRAKKAKVDGKETAAVGESSKYSSSSSTGVDALEPDGATKIAV